MSEDKGPVNSKFTGFGHAGVTLGANGLELKISEVWISLIFELGCSAAALAFSSYLLEKINPVPVLPSYLPARL